MKNSRKTILFARVAALLFLIAVGIAVLALNSDERKLNRQLELGQKYLEEMDYEQAIVAFDEAIKIDPANVEAYLGLADAHFRLGEYEDSLACIDGLLELDNENTQIKPILTECLSAYIKILAEEERYDEIKALAEKYGSIAEGVDFEAALAGAPIEVEVFKTDIEADSVVNEEGYGCLRIDGAGDSWDVWSEEEADSIILPQKAVVDREGSIIFPYKSTYLTYHTSDGIVSLTDNSAYWPSENYDVEENLPQYYHLDGSSVFETALTTNEYDNYAVGDAVYESVREDRFWRGIPMQDGYALAINQINWWYWSGFAGGTSSEYHSYIIDQNGAIVCTLPEEFNEEIELGLDGFTTKYALGWCGEGLFGVFEHDYDEEWNYSSEAKGYMDFSGNMALDLSGRGFTDLYPFHEGLAAVRSEDDMIGFIDKSGEFVIPCIYENFSGEFSEEGLCAVQKDGKWGYIDRDNNVVIPFAYDDAYGAGDGLASVIKDGKCGLVDYRNRIVVELEYDDISSPYDATVYAVKDRTLYIITRK